MKKLKNIDFKALFIDHGEKFGFGLILLIVVIALSGTSWSRYQETPEALKAKVDAAKARINSPENKWPAAKAEQFQIVDFTGQAVEVFRGMKTAKYEFSTNMFWPLYRKKEKAREPEYKAPQNLIADSGRAILGISAKPTGLEMADSTDGNSSSGPNAAADTPPPSSDLKIQPGAVAATGAGGSGPTPGAGHGFGINPATANPVRPPNSGTMPSTATSSGPTSEMAMMYGASGYGGGGVSGVTAKGKRYVAIRAIVPLKEQIESASKALNLSYADASLAVEYTDFILERQTAVAGSDPWSGEWELVKQDYALEVLQECTDFDPDPVPSDLQDAVFTMPLPYRLVRYWGDHATHPKIKNFKLSDAEMQREMAIQAKALQEYEKLKLESEPKVKKKGLTSVVNDMRQIGRTLTTAPEGNTAMQAMQRYMNEGPNAQRMTVPDIQDRLTASGRLYLFRYFDFDVQPGMAYRYRLKLELRNPNFERPYEEVEDQAVTKGPYRETAWSNISNPTVVPETVHYYLKDVERDPVREEKQSKKPVASIAMFKWDADLGTMLYDTLKVLNVGQFVGEKKKTWVLDPGTPSFEEKPDVALQTEDMLVDASGDLDLNPDLHPDLQLKPERGKRDVRVGMLPEALVVNEAGELEQLNPAAKTTEEKELKQRVDEERKGFEYLKNQPQQSGSALDGPVAGMPMPGMPGMPGMPMPGPKNARKKQGAGGAHGMMMDAGPGGRSSASGSSSGSSSGGRNGRQNRGASSSGP